MKSDTLVFLSMMSWSDIAAAHAEHVYGSLQGNHTRTEYDVYRILSESDAIEINQKDNNRSVAFGFGCPAFTWKAGSKYTGFDTETTVIEQAKTIWKDLFPEAKFLILGSSHVASPQEIIAGDLDNPIVEKINALVKEYKDPNKMKKALFCQVFGQLMNELKKEQNL